MSLEQIRAEAHTPEECYCSAKLTPHPVRNREMIFRVCFGTG